MRSSLPDAILTFLIGNSLLLVIRLAMRPSLPSTMSITLPEWLRIAITSDKYLEHAIEITAARERKRENARDATRHNNERNNRYRLKVSPSQVLNRIPNDHIEHYRVEVGSRPEHLSHNRYYAIEPYDRTRVVVDGHYLNANWVRELHGGRWWIATQAPLPRTIHPFLSLFYQQDTAPPPQLAPRSDAIGGRVRTVVQLTLATEGGRSKAYPYFPPDVGDSYVVPSPDNVTVPCYKITLEAQRTIDEAHCVQSSLRLAQCDDHGQNEGKSVKFTHLLFMSWPDHGIPESPEEKAALITFVRHVATVNRSVTEEGEHPDPPIVVGCSAGVGRTGSFIALSSVLRSHGLLLPVYPPSTKHDFPPLPESPLGPLPPEIQEDAVASEVDSLREQRPAMVQRWEQMSLVYELVYSVYEEKSIKSAS